MSKEVERYTFVCDIENDEYVRASDYEALLAERDALKKDAERYQWLCEKFGVTKLPCAIERILAGEVYVADGKTSIDAAIDAALQGEQP